MSTTPSTTYHPDRGERLHAFLDARSTFPAIGDRQQFTIYFLGVLSGLVDDDTWADALTFAVDNYPRIEAAS